MNQTQDELDRTADGDPLVDRGIAGTAKNSVTQPDEEPDETEEDPEEGPEEEEDL